MNHWNIETLEEYTFHKQWWLPVQMVPYCQRALKSYPLQSPHRCRVNLSHISALVNINAVYKPDGSSLEYCCQAYHTSLSGAKCSPWIASRTISQMMHVVSVRLGRCIKAEGDEEHVELR